MTIASSSESTGAFHHREPMHHAGDEARCRERESAMPADGGAGRNATATAERRIRRPTATSRVSAVPSRRGERQLRAETTRRSPPPRRHRAIGRRWSGEPTQRIMHARLPAATAHRSERHLRASCDSSVPAWRVTHSRAVASVVCMVGSQRAPVRAPPTANRSGSYRTVTRTRAPGTSSSDSSSRSTIRNADNSTPGWEPVQRCPRWSVWPMVERVRSQQRLQVGERRLRGGGDSSRSAPTISRMSVSVRRPSCSIAVSDSRAASG